MDDTPNRLTFEVVFAEALVRISVASSTLDQGVLAMEAAVRVAIQKGFQRRLLACRAAENGSDAGETISGHPLCGLLAIEQVTPQC